MASTRKKISKAKFAYEMSCFEKVERQCSKAELNGLQSASKGECINGFG